MERSQGLCLGRSKAVHHLTAGAQASGLVERIWDVELDNTSLSSSFATHPTFYFSEPQFPHIENKSSNSTDYKVVAKIS